MLRQVELVQQHLDLFTARFFAQKLGLPPLSRRKLIVRAGLAATLVLILAVNHAYNVVDVGIAVFIVWCVGYLLCNVAYMLTMMRSESRPSVVAAEPRSVGLS